MQLGDCAGEGGEGGEEGVVGVVEAAGGGCAEGGEGGEGGEEGAGEGVGSVFCVHHDLDRLVGVGVGDLLVR